MNTKRKTWLGLIAATAITIYFGYQTDVHKEPTKAKEIHSDSTISCSFYNELISVGFSEEEALLNINCCKDKNCIYEHHILPKCNEHQTKNFTANTEKQLKQEIL